MDMKKFKNWITGVWLTNCGKQRLERESKRDWSIDYGYGRLKPD
jgi:hypothetical protein